MSFNSRLYRHVSFYYFNILCYCWLWDQYWLILLLSHCSEPIRAQQLWFLSLLLILCFLTELLKCLHSLVQSAPTHISLCSLVFTLPLFFIFSLLHIYICWLPNILGFISSYLEMICVRKQHNKCWAETWWETVRSSQVSWQQVGGIIRFA